MPLKKIRLELARTPEFPEGSSEFGYEFIAPLDEKGNFCSAEWKTEKNNCTVHRFWKNENDDDGYLVRHRGNVWVFDYDDQSLDDDEPIFKFDHHNFNEGEYVSITEHNGVQHPFKIVSVK